MANPTGNTVRISTSALTGKQTVTYTDRNGIVRYASMKTGVKKN